MGWLLAIVFQAGIVIGAGAASSEWVVVVMGIMIAIPTARVLLADADQNQIDEAEHG